MAIIGINPNATKPFVLDSDRDSDAPTEWHIRPLNAQAAANAMDRLASSGGALAGSLIRELLIYGLRDVTGLVDEDGADIEFQSASKPAQALGVKVTNPVREVFLDRIPNQVRQEIAMAIFDASRLTDDDAKN